MGNGQLCSPWVHPTFAEIPTISNYQLDETDYLLSTEANRQHLQEAIESLKNPDSYIYVDAANL
ncbi:hypothetical protein D3800_21105 [Microcystis aeruginosa NIES-298]|jgi:antitoxin YefM|uniref:Uncharacterized protein n=5 Tax=Microcystis TaxID=1125 RepID=A0A2H6BYC2_MICAE|nr:hypothetical protein [Microcystis aeruginosa]MBD2600816.1 hypothetical protein [Microcystis viridis FACHB-1342]MCA2623439.1 hypothetical protein [Microcystis sp. M19BS1]MCA2631667.1 hypothetical protein [Microcystis sp. M20BS1]NCR99611.1 hypothetical protein [Microcystis aeruginosa L311-01]OCY14870.1 MAG: hypothetical protein BEV12_17170 [Microcystis aeruginosa CACIAM 03]REJ58702.1 MAG: hypothetical protein DWQ56_06000 [Microcystis aeruginosa DA14]ROI01050.1 hypothetical protein ED562_153